MKKLEFRPDRSLPVHRLPFVRLRKKSVCFWNVPRVGGYSRGCETGRALALVYLSFLREHNQEMTFLQYIVLDMFGMKSKKNVSSSYSSLRGQIVGFFSELDRLLYVRAKQENCNLDRQDVRKIATKANMILR